MAGLLEDVEITDEQRQAHDKNDLRVVIVVLAVFLLFAYLFTHLPARLGLPTPRDCILRFHLLHRYIGQLVSFSPDGSFNTALNAQATDLVSDEIALILGLGAIGFLASYFLPFSYKRPALVICTLVALGVLYGPRATLVLVGCHALVYLLLHRLRDSPATRVVQNLVVQAPFIVVLFGGIANGLFGTRACLRLPLGVLMFFWHWRRLTLYHLDFRDKLIPSGISFEQYLSVFLNPGAVPNWPWGSEIGQGYSYLESTFLVEDKNRIVRRGLKLAFIALGYLIIADWAYYRLGDALNAFKHVGIDVHMAKISTLISDFELGQPIRPFEVLLATFFDFFRWMFAWGGVVHFKAALWCFSGYRMDPYLDKPWMATNLVSLWSRWAFHYRECLVRAFYYPVFFRFLKNHPRLRVTVATFAAATVGNLVWGHVTVAPLYARENIEWYYVIHTLEKFPYFVLLGASIAASELFLLWKRRKPRTRNAWDLDRWILLDVLCAYATLQFWLLIHIFVDPTLNGSVWDRTRLFLIAFGIHL